MLKNHWEKDLLTEVFLTVVSDKKYWSTFSSVSGGLAKAYETDVLMRRCSFYCFLKYILSSTLSLYLKLYVKPESNYIINKRHILLLWGFFLV